MKNGHLLFSAVHLIVTFFIIASGLLSMSLFFNQETRFRLAHMLENEGASLFFAVGVAVTFVGVMLLIGFYMMYRRRYYKIRMNCSKVLVDQSIVKEYVSDYWSKLFPGEKLFLDVAFGANQHLEVITQVPRLEKDQRELVFKRVENELGVILARKIGYEKEFVLTVCEA